MATNMPCWAEFTDGGIYVLDWNAYHEDGEIPVYAQQVEEEQAVFAAGKADYR